MSSFHASRHRRARVILVGCGSLGSVRAKLLFGNPRFDLCAICDVDLARAQDMADLYACESFATLEEALTFYQSATSECMTSFGHRNDGNVSPDTTGQEVPSVISTESSGYASSSSQTSSLLDTIDGVILSVPTPFHSECIELAARNNLTIFVEKPVAESAQEVRYLTNLCENKGVRLCCGFQRRFDESFVAAAEKVRSGELGAPLSATIFFGDHPCPPIEFLKAGGNIFSDLAIHDVNYIRYALDDEVKSVYAVASNTAPELEAIGVHDTAVMMLRFNRGTLVTITISRRSCYGYDQRCEIFCEKGMVAVGNEHKTGVAVSDNRGVQLSNLKHSYPQRYQQAYASEMDSFADVLLFRKPWPVSYDDLVEDLKIIEAAKESAAADKTVYL